MFVVVIVVGVFVGVCAFDEQGTVRLLLIFFFEDRADARGNFRFGGEAGLHFFLGKVLPVVFGCADERQTLRFRFFWVFLPSSAFFINCA